MFLVEIAFFEMAFELGYEVLASSGLWWEGRFYKGIKGKGEENEIDKYRLSQRQKES